MPAIAPCTAGAARSRGAAGAAPRRTRTPGAALLALGLALGLAATLAPPPARAADRLDVIAATQTLRVCIWPDYYGVSYRNPRTQELMGIDVDNAHALALALGASVKFVDSSFARFLDDLGADRCDIAMFGIGITPARQQRAQFTQPHLVSDMYAITTKTNRRIRDWADLDQRGVVIAVVKGTVHHELLAKRLKAAELRVVDSPLAREQEVTSGRADAFMSDYPYTRRMLDHHDWARVIAPSTPFEPTPYAWAMAPGQPRWLERVERELAAMKADGRLAANARRHGLEAIVVR